MRHYLNFIKTIGLIEISEPFGFDGSTHKVEQGSEYGRDVILGDEEIDLTLTESHFEPLEFPQQFTNGVQFDYASHAFDYLKDVLKNEGWEAEIEYILEKDGLQFSKGIIDGLTAVTEFEQITFKVIQNTKREEVKRRMDVVINAFSDVDLDGNTITPCETVDLLLKAKPIQQKSSWVLKEVNNKQDVGTAFQSISIIPLGDTLSIYNIEDTFVPFFSYLHIFSYTTESLAQGISDTKIVTAQTELSFVTIKAKQLSFFGSFGISGIGTFCRVVARRFIAGNLVGLSNVTYDIPIISNSFQVVEQDYDFYFPLINQGESIQVCLEFGFSSSLLQDYNMQLFSFKCEGLSIETTSTSIDSIVKAVRYIDLLKHTCESVGLPVVDCPEYDLGGEHYDNFALNGYLIGQITDKPFNNKLKDVLEVTKELNHGYQINPENIEVLHHDEFFKDVEIGAFIQIPNLINKTEMNTELAVKTFDYNYKNSSKGRETNSEGSIDDIHGQSQRLFPSKKTDKNLKFELDHIRSAFLIEEQRRRVFDNENTTSLQGDDKLYLIKAVPLAPSAVGGFTATLQMQIQTSPFPALKILSNNFRWDLLGIGIFTTFKITAGENVATYSINAIEPNVITLTSTAFFSPNPPNFTGTATITIEYNFTNVSLTNQTNEGYTLIEGVQNNDNYSNLDYSIGRNLKRFYSMLGACGRYLSGVIKTTMFEVNGNLVTQKVGETVTTSDSGDIDLEQIKELRLYEPRLETVTVFAEFETATELFEKVATDKGFIRVQKSDNSVISGFPKEMEYKWMDGSLEMKLMAKKESEYYDVDLNLVSSYQINNNLFVSLYDVNDILIVTPLRFDKIPINGVIYTDEIDFANTLSNAIE
jgi:hypothetical protein